MQDLYSPIQPLVQAESPVNFFDNNNTPAYQLEELTLKEEPNAPSQLEQPSKQPLTNQAIEEATRK